MCIVHYQQHRWIQNYTEWKKPGTKDKYCMILLIQNINQSIRTKSRSNISLLGVMKMFCLDCDGGFMGVCTVKINGIVLF